MLSFEQGFEMCMIHDGLDEQGIHIGAFVNGEMVGSCRLLRKDDSTFKLGRMVVIKNHRLKGCGSAILEYVFNNLLLRHPGVLYIDIEAQKQASEFYKKHEFNIISSEYIICLIPHYTMRWSRKR